MKLFELIEPETTTKKYRGHFRNPDPDTVKPETDELAGYYSQVRHDRDGHTVTKRSKHPVATASDPYWGYLDYIEQNRLFDNPHFPRFYKKTEIEDGSGKRMAKVNVERLQPLKSMNLDEAMGMFERYFKEVPPSLNRLYTQVKVKEEESGSQHEKILISGKEPIEHFLYIFIGYLNAVLMAPGYAEKLIHDETLFEAVQHLRNFKSQNITALWNISKDNVMLRRTPVGPQIVFTDIFA